MVLPWLESLGAQVAATKVPTRMVCIGNNFGFVPQLFFPEGTGNNYKSSHLLKALDHHRSEFSVFTHLDHGSDVQDGHGGVHTYLSGVHTKMAKSLPESNITIDQKAAEWVGGATRYPSLQFGTADTSNNRISWSRSGVAIPAVLDPSKIYSLLFRQVDQAKTKSIDRELAAHSSILDLVRDEANRLSRKVGARDREKLDQYFTSVREVEVDLERSRDWLYKPKPEMGYTIPDRVDSLDLADRMSVYYDLMALALQTDSTRIITLAISGIGPNYGGLPLTRDYHRLTHHGKVESYLAELTVIEEFHMKQFALFLDRLKSIKEPNGKTLLDNTMTLFGSGMGNANSHSNKDLPLILAGGGFKHGQHLAFPKDKRATPAANLFVSMLQRFGMETEQFNFSTGTLTGLEVA